jgi:hypothetical protein
MQVVPDMGKGIDGRSVCTEARGEPDAGRKEEPPWGSQTAEENGITRIKCSTDGREGSNRYGRKKIQRVCTENKMQRVSRGVQR